MHDNSFYFNTEWMIFHLIYISNAILFVLFCYTENILPLIVRYNGLITNHWISIRMSYLGYKPYPIFAIYLKIRIQRYYLIELLQFLLSLHWLQLIPRQVAATALHFILCQRYWNSKLSLVQHVCSFKREALSVYVLKIWK